MYVVGGASSCAMKLNEHAHMKHNHSKFNVKRINFVSNNMVHCTCPTYHALSFQYTRAETILSGIVVRPDPNDSGSSKITLLGQTDMKGHIPKAVFDFVTTKDIVKWRSIVANHYAEQQAKK